ncbi:hypothetical protein DPMN_146686 [Dreissena polymorpha]|nr:hypothetical protein DPMN_146686 [Dreissena polymorpha]
MKHLKIAQELEDRVGEGRACWSLGNAHTALGVTKRLCSMPANISRSLKRLEMRQVR